MKGNLSVDEEMGKRPSGKGREVRGFCRRPCLEKERGLWKMMDAGFRFSGIYFPDLVRLYIA